MARPSKIDKDLAVSEAMQAIWSDGYAATSVKAMSERLGITRSSYYNAFGSQEALFKAALTSYAALSPDHVLAEIDDDEPILPLITVMFKTICRVRAEDRHHRGCMIVNALAELAGSHDELGPFLEDWILQSAARLEHLLTIAIQNGELPADTDAHAKALALQASLLGLNTLSKALHSEAELWITAKASLKGLGLFAEAN
ncbi:TetR/AcrR family transcriptional regulator [Cognatishimia activa]|uniref:Copper outer membrane regulator n=1 Tax=Cognatishimia activa TaxID=1715691 RepID=A0A0P1IP27_9RHOB|nr:TetR/AcrR family transcriptional regulator [Cognatishimia activa]CUJ25304.1 Copper outer membrane regulator [Cognatishimia activa]CUK25334.1 Copper outer membrane regulator [Cognatishimia activa]